MTSQWDSARPDDEARRVAAGFSQSVLTSGLLQLVTSFGPFLAGRIARYLVLRPVRFGAFDAKARL